MDYGLPRPPKTGPGVGIPPQTNEVRGRKFLGWTGRGCLLGAAAGNDLPQMSAQGEDSLDRGLIAGFF